MAEATLPNFDTSWIEALDLPDDAKKTLLASVEDKVKDFQRGMTKAQQEAAGLRKEVEAWRAFEQDGNTQILRDWGKYKPILDRFRSAEELEETLTAQRTQQQQQVNTSAREQAADIEQRYQEGEISWEDAQKMLITLDRQLKQAKETIDQQFTTFREKELPGYVKQFGDALTGVQQQMLSTQRQLLPLMLEASRYERIHPDRKAEEILAHMGEEGITDFNEATRRLYGEDDQKSWQEEERQRIRQEVEAELDAARNKETDPAVAPTAPPRFGLRDEEGQRRPPLSSQQFNQAVYERASKAGL